MRRLVLAVHSGERWKQIGDSAHVTPSIPRKEIDPLTSSPFADAVPANDIDPDSKITERDSSSILISPLVSVPRYIVWP